LFFAKLFSEVARESGACRNSTFGSRSEGVCQPKSGLSLCAALKRP